jgi:ribosomal protein S18 acetylase RimI-like enzyme
MNAGFPDKIIFRPIQLDDIESVLALGRSSLPYVDLASSDTDLHDYNTLYLMSGLTFKELSPVGPDSPLSLSVVAEIDNKVIGFLLAYAHFIGIPVTKICAIHAIVVDPDYHGQGIGIQLLNHLQTKCKEEGIKIMRILVRQHNTQLSNYIGSLGFHRSKVVIFDKLVGDEG